MQTCPPYGHTERPYQPMWMIEHEEDFHHCHALSSTLPCCSCRLPRSRAAAGGRVMGCILWLSSRTTLCYRRAWPVEDSSHSGCHAALTLLHRAAPGGGRLHAALATPCRMPTTRRGGCPAMDLGRPRRIRVANVPETTPVSPCTRANHAPSPGRDVTRSKKMHGHGAHGPFIWPATLHCYQAAGDWRTL